MIRVPACGFQDRANASLCGRGRGPNRLGGSYQLEVDAVVETPDGRVIAVEVKSGATVRAEDLAGLRHLASHVGERFVAGYVMYTGQQTLSFGGKIKALPVEALWQLGP